MTDLTTAQRQALLRYLDGEDINEIARSCDTLKVSDIKRCLYDLDTRSRLGLERELRLDALCKINSHIKLIENKLTGADEPYDIRNLTVAYGVLCDKRIKINDEIGKIEAQIVSTKRVRSSNEIKIRTDYEDISND